MHEFRLRVFVYLVLLPVMLVFFLSAGCVSDKRLLTTSHAPVTDVGGAQVNALHLPTRSGVSHLCTQGAHGRTSHQGRSTQFGLDLDTPNDRVEEVYAPISGTLYVHEEDPARDFGRHLAIDVGDGTYVVLGHLSAIAVANASEVAVGQFLGYEGCTGNCSGDHIHIGLNRGDARRPAQFGESIPATYLVADAASPGGSRLLGSEAFVCGIQAAGDEQDGDRYGSILPTTHVHPDGMLVKTLGSPRVFLLENGRTRWIETEQIFRSLDYAFADVITISDDEFGCYPQGPSVREDGLVDVVEDEEGALWLILGLASQADRHRLALSPLGASAVLASWGMQPGRHPMRVGADHVYLMDWPVRETYAQIRDGSVVKERGRPDVYLISHGVAMPVADWQTYLLLGLGSRTILEVNPGDLAYLHGELGSCERLVNCVNQQQVTQCGGLNPVALAEAPPAQVAIAMDPDQEVVPVQEGVIEEDVEVPDAFVADAAMIPVVTNGQDAAQEMALSPDAFVSSDTQMADDDPPEPDVFEDPPQENVLDRCDDLACIIDADGDGREETLILSDDIWVAEALEGLDAYLYGNGGCFDSVLTPRDLVHSENDYYFVDFSRFRNACVVQMSLVSVRTSDEQSLNPDRSNWQWWQTAELCGNGHPLCELMHTNDPWENWLIAVAWDPQRGLVANGNAFVANAQL